MDLNTMVATATVVRAASSGQVIFVNFHLLAQRMRTTPLEAYVVLPIAWLRALLLQPISVLLARSVPYPEPAHGHGRVAVMEAVRMLPAALQYIFLLLKLPMWLPVRIHGQFQRTLRLCLQFVSAAEPHGLLLRAHWEAREEAVAAGLPIKTTSLLLLVVQ